MKQRNCEQTTSPIIDIVVPLPSSNPSLYPRSDLGLLMFGLCYFGLILGFVPDSDCAGLGSPWKIYVRKFHADGIRWFNTLDNLKQFIVQPPRSLTQTNMERLGGMRIRGVAGQKLYFLLFYFIALTSLNMFVRLVRPTCFALPSSRLPPRRGRWVGWRDVAWWVIPRNWCVFWGHKNYKNFIRLFGLIVCDWEEERVGPHCPLPTPLALGCSGCPVPGPLDSLRNDINYIERFELVFYVARM